ncbi:hypothetical protein AB6A40_007011 [Gnathostoma spinigerum]|uniref:Ribosomal protein eL8/eL30/eS12/Gadd45 domain-containing protein n=1 Tax=Gnathostoma spinigerum TaxID=75299 RepID=A0ABD6EUQ7_9BILA
MVKVKMEVDDEGVTQIEAEPPPQPSTEKDEYAELCLYVNAIAQPLASRKLAKKIYKLIKKASKHKDHLRQGISDVQKSIRREETGIVILAGNVSPIDVYSHIPALCEEKDLPYVFTPSREHLGLATGHRRATIILLIRENAEYSELFNEVKKLITMLPPVA